MNTDTLIARANDTQNAADFDAAIEAIRADGTLAWLVMGDALEIENGTTIAADWADEMADRVAHLETADDAVAIHRDAGKALEMLGYWFDL